MTASALLQAVLGTLALVSIGASVVAVLRANLATTTIDQLRLSNAALIERVGLLELENGRQAARLTALQEENAALLTYVNGTDAIRVLAASIAESDQVRLREHDETLALLRAIKET